MSSKTTYYYVLISSPNKILKTKSVAELITLLYNEEADLITDAQRSELKLPKDYVQSVKKAISSDPSRVPLYDIAFGHIYLIESINVYPRILHDNYRFVDEAFYNDLTKLTNQTDADKKNIHLLSFYDFAQLKKTYFKIFYESFVLNSYITTCRRPSFSSRMSHIRPYYDISELYYMGVDWDLIKPDETLSLDSETVRSLCKKISGYDVPAETLLAHQAHILKNKSIGLIKNYSLFGSYFINKYLREYGCCVNADLNSDKVLIKNSVLENQIRLMIKLIATAPTFQTDHTVYRFIESDDYMRNLKVGDMYTDPSFMSTTRNPFVYQENYNFGYILLKIKIPAGIVGIGLCVESYSNFPSEEEIIFPPTSTYELVKITDNPGGHHHYANEKFPLNKINKKYEFVLKSNSFMQKPTSIDSVPMLPLSTEPQILHLDFAELIADPNIKAMGISDRLTYFTQTYLNANSQFQARVNNLDITFIIESYNSMSVYKPFFIYETTAGLLMYSFNPTYGNISIMLELGPEIHLNYYFKYSLTDTSVQLSLNNPEWIRWLSLLAFVLGSRTVVIHSNYVLSQEATDQIQTRYTHSEDIYVYMRHKKKKFSSYAEVTPNFDYAQLDKLFLVDVFDILKSTDHDELYAIAKKSGVKNIGDFYIHIVDSMPSVQSVLDSRIAKFYETEGAGSNPFDSVNYSLDAWAYLLNNGLVSYVPNERDFLTTKSTIKKLVAKQSIPQFRNRLREYLSK